MIANAARQIRLVADRGAARGGERDAAGACARLRRTTPRSTGVSVEEPERFWRAVADDLELELARPWDRVRDDSRGIEWTTWFEGARLNIAQACVHAWASGRPTRSRRSSGARTARRDEWTFAAALASRSCSSRRRSSRSASAPATASRSTCRWRRKPPSPRTPAPTSAAIQVPIFSGFAAPAVVQRLQDSGAKAVITADYSLRRGTRVPMRETIEEALRDSPTVEHVVEWSPGRSELGRRARSGRAAAARGRGGASVSARVHVRDDRAPEGRAARARRLPALDRPRGRLPVRHPRRRPRPLRNRHGLDHGAVDGGRRRRRSALPSSTWRARPTGPTTGSGS